MVEETCNNEARKGGCLNDAKTRCQALFDEVNRIIDDCDELRSTQWSEVMEVFNEKRRFRDSKQERSRSQAVVECRS
jgi:hypothetical protein